MHYSPPLLPYCAFKIFALYYLARPHRCLRLLLDGPTKLYSPSTGYHYQPQEKSDFGRVSWEQCRDIIPSRTGD